MTDSLRTFLSKGKNMKHQNILNKNKKLFSKVLVSINLTLKAGSNEMDREYACP
jgi:hypothetical protein